MGCHRFGDRGAAAGGKGGHERCGKHRPAGQCGADRLGGPAVMTLRLRLWLLTCLIALDQLAHVLLAGPKYILAGGPRPNPDETISSRSEGHTSELQSLMR